MLTYLAARLGFAVLLTLSSIDAQIGARTDLLFWLCLCVYALVLNLRFVSRKFWLFDSSEWAQRL
jgi:hypothetical protein